MNASNNYWRRRYQSFRYAFRGIAAFIRSEPHARIHALATIVVVVAGFYVHLPAVQWTLLLLVIGLVWVSEMINTVIEKIMDHLAPEWHERVGWIKDVAAGAVLVSAIIAVVAGALIFLPFLHR
ncbi:undecaprenol kinase/diacylglycerol kinase (ATP) [Chitinophaga costaii]|uniref:Undecaprenol kinase/diacylglycerol kinase (ATP) n=1 Tax=Chitinophaga costaii TaxID=1335309 RepID=A0A1C4DW44_9BACT|nr:diacylglycerol kinase family protein [Chitinophaga costaii]PUZ27827.1 diacylglycerol kinase family protein [Chitinophaga costaii]SCC35490.1 undecaprenol kinase/diacylglycerol kinase (ATP) [Chitinophaga costaii]